MDADERARTVIPTHEAAALIGRDASRVRQLVRAHTLDAPEGKGRGVDRGVYLDSVQDYLAKRETAGQAKASEGAETAARVAAENGNDVVESLEPAPDLQSQVQRLQARVAALEDSQAFKDDQVELLERAYRARGEALRLALAAVDKENDAVDLARRAAEKADRAREVRERAAKLGY